MKSLVFDRVAIGLRGGLLGLLAFALMGLSAPALQAQTGQITGTVTNAASGGPVSETQVFLEGESIGTLSRADGRYLILNVPAGTYDVTAQRIGFGSITQSVTVTAGATATVNFTMETQALGLDEIVVTGAAGAARRREIGNTISQVEVADIQDSGGGIEEFLGGSAPGIDIVGAASEPGMGKQIRLRGNSSVAMSNRPLIYVDGVRIMDGGTPAVGSVLGSAGLPARLETSPLDQINPNDIDRIEVIKGSAATTLYGTEASAGVIQIFTKRGSSGAPQWAAEISQGTGWMQPFGLHGGDFLNMQHYIRDAWWGGGYATDLIGGEECVTAGGDKAGEDRWAHQSDARGNCSWEGAQWYQNYDLSVRGGGQALQYFLSGNYQDDSYTKASDELTKYQFRGNFTLSPAQDLQIQWNTSFSSQWLSATPSGNNAEGIELNAFRQERNYVGSADPRDIADLLQYDFQQWNERLNTGITLNYSPIQDLSNRFTVGYDFSQQEGRNLRNFGFFLFPQGSLGIDLWQKRVLTFDYVGTYSTNLTDAVRTSFSWGGQAIGDDVRRVRSGGIDFPGAAEPTLSSAALTRSLEDREKVWNAGFFFQNVFDINDKYFITGGVRVDGNSAFGKNFGLQVYPKVSGSYVISDEDFFPAGAGSLKLRIAYGQSGRAPGAFDAVRTWQPQGFDGRPAFSPENRGNPDLAPEVTSEFEFGFDGSWFSDRLSVGFTYFDQVTTDALMNVSAIQSQGFTRSQLENVGQVSNWGQELQVNAALLQGATWGVDLGLAVTLNDSKVDSLCRDPADLTSCIDDFSDLNGRIIEGLPVPVNRDERVLNRDQLTDDISEVEYVDDPNTAAVLSRGENIPIGRLNPTTFISPSLTIRVPGNITINARGEYRGGNNRYVNEIAISRSIRSPYCYPFYVDPANSIALIDGIPAIERARCTPGARNDYWFDSDYFKLRSISAAIPVDFAFPDRVSNATLTLALNNFWDWYREIPWYDVESPGNNAVNDDGIGSQTERVPAPALFRLSLRVTF